MNSDSEAEGELLERVAALKHDLGKYVAWRSVNLADELWRGPVGDELMEALRADLLCTRQRAERATTAWDLWDDFCAEVPHLAPELKRVSEAVACLRAAGPALRDKRYEEIESRRDGLRDAQLVIREELRKLHRRLLLERSGQRSEAD